MSSELTIDIQLTELGFSSWDFQVLKQKETHQISELDDASSSSSSSSSLPSTTLPRTTSPVELPVDEGHASSQPVPRPVSHPEAALVHGETTDPSAAVCETASGRVGKKRRREGSRKEENADERLRERKKEETHKGPRKNFNLREGSARRSRMEVSGEEDEEEEDEDEEETEVEEEDNDEDLTDEEECDDALSSDRRGSEEHRCRVCKLTFPTTFFLHEHLHVHNGVRLYRCAECGKQFCHSVNYRRHLRSHARAPGIRCIVCTAQFPTQEDLQRHLDTNHFEDEFYECDLCKRIFTSMAECKKHVQTHRRRTKRYPCPKCERSFRHHSSMLYHLKRHKKGVFLCTDCGLAFSTKGVLLRHSFHHLGLLPYTCIRCKRHFRLSSQYMKHDCKPEQLQCEACLVIFPNEEDFLKHKKDTGCWGHHRAFNAKANNIRCMECGQVFDSSEELKKHAGTHQRVMRCSECGMGFRSSIMLMSHMAGHAAQRPCLCKECGLGFCHQQAYDSHLKTCGLEKPAEIGLKKGKPESKKKTDKSRQIETVPQLVHLQPNSAVISASHKPAKGPTVFTLNKQPISPVPLVMLVPASSTSAPAAIPNPQTLTSNVPKKSVPAPQVIHISLPSNCSVPKESDHKTVVLKDPSQTVPASKVLIPVTTLKTARTGWTLLDGAGASCPVTKILVIKKGNKPAADINSKPMLHHSRFQAKKKNILSNMEILQVLSMIKKNACGERTKISVPCSTTSTSAHGQTKADEEKKRETVKPETSKPPPQKSSAAELAVKIDTIRYNVNAGNLQPHRPDPSALMCDVKKNQPEQDQSSKPLIHLLSTVSSTPDELQSESNVQKPAEQRQEEDPDPDSAAMDLSMESDIVQCETCGKMILEKNMVEHITAHSASTFPATS